MKILKAILLALSVVVLLASGYMLVAALLHAQGQSEAVTQLLRDQQEKAEADQKLGQYALNMMNETAGGRKLSDAKKLLLARTLVRVTNDVFDQDAYRRRYIMMVAMESGFSRNAQSPTGPKGYAQLAKKAFEEGMASCGLEAQHSEDVWDEEINLIAGACYFRMLIGMKKDLDTASVAYNQGPHGKDTLKYEKGGRMDNLEPLQYIQKITYLTSKVTDKKVPGVPSLVELPQVRRLAVVRE